MPRILIVDDEFQSVHKAKLALTGVGEISIANDFETALGMLRPAELPFDVMLLDINIPGAPIDGLDFLKQLKANGIEVPTIMVTGEPDLRVIERAIALGAVEYIVKPAEDVRLRTTVASVLGLAEARARVEHLLTDRFVGESPKVQALRNTVIKVARSSASVLLLGETGTGKEVIASMLHSLSGRASGPFITHNCAIDTILESELFGHERGAFTGAASRRVGKFEAAKQGTLFLDEVDKMSLDAQGRVLRTLQSRTIQRLGGNQEIPVDFRLIAASARDLQKGVADGWFREDLYFRIKVVHLTLPPLRDRTGDIRVLAHHFLRELNIRYKMNVQLEKAAIELLEEYAWAGNVRELENFLESAALQNASGTISRFDVMKGLGMPTRQPLAAPSKGALGRSLGGSGHAAYDGSGTLEELQENWRAALLREAFVWHEGDLARIAEALGITPSSTRELLMSYGIE